MENFFLLVMSEQNKNSMTLSQKEANETHMTSFDEGRLEARFEH